jgi:polyketide synthase PksN
MAIAGGVNTMLNPRAHVSFGKAGMLSRDGRCKTFSAAADGYGRGEGVGMLVLKPLAQAERDGDHIYAVIRGSAVNHGGRGNSLTAPNSVAQAELLKMAYTEAAIDPRTVTYVEAHGTGTPLGDPIEVDGLRRAFHDLAAASDSSAAPARCGLGSVKTNIGHLELAAGVAGLTKVVLQLRHKTLVKSLHCDQLNPLIDLEDTPFYVVRDTAEWSSGQDPDGRPLPRRAGVSSFGLGGVNAHVVLEEYVEPAAAAIPLDVASRPAIIVLSAKQEVQLREQVRQLLTAIESGRFTDRDLPSLAYTLQLGREAFEYRLAFTTASIESLRETLTRILGDTDIPAGVWRGDTRRHKEALTVFGSDDELRDAVSRWLDRAKYGTLLELWVKGLAVDWNQLYRDYRPRRSSLPTYPFARDKYPLGAARHAPLRDLEQRRDAGPDAHHPLIQRNTSTFDEQRFSSTFDGREFFLADHRVCDTGTLPAAAYFEMVRAAIVEAVPAAAETLAQQTLRLMDHGWRRPLRVGDAPVTVHLAMSLSARSGEVEYAIYSNPADADTEIVHAEGRASLTSHAAPSIVEIAALRACSAPTRTGAECYGRWAAHGFAYGPGHRGLEQLFEGQTDDGAPFMLARIVVPPAVAATAGRYGLHPSIVDAAVQAAVAWTQDVGAALAGPNQRLPVAVAEVEIIATTPLSGWAYVRRSATGAASDTVQLLDIDLCDDAGHPALRLHELALAAIDDDEVVTRAEGAVSSLMVGSGVV